MITRIIPLVILVSALHTLPLWAADGTMKFSGKLTESACELDTSSKNQTVDLGRRSANVGSSIFAENVFSIQFNHCPASSNRANVRFEGTQATSTGYRADRIFAFSNTGQPGAAENVGFVISEGHGPTGKPVYVNQSKTYFLDGISSTVKQLTFFVGYYGLNNGTPTPGVSVGQVQFSVDYP